MKNNMLLSALRVPDLLDSIASNDDIQYAVQLSFDDFANAVEMLYNGDFTLHEILCELCYAKVELKALQQCSERYYKAGKKCTLRSLYESSARLTRMPYRHSITYRHPVTA